MDWIVSACKDFECELIKIRRELHMIPEIGNELPLTREYVCKCLEKWEIPYRKNKKNRHEYSYKYQKVSSLHFLPSIYAFPFYV